MMTKGEIPNSNTPPRPRHREEDSKCVKLTKHNWRESTTKQQESEQHLSNFSNGTLCMVTSSSEGLLRPILRYIGPAMVSWRYFVNEHPYDCEYTSSSSYAHPPRTSWRAVMMVVVVMVVVMMVVVMMVVVMMVRDD